MSDVASLEIGSEAAKGAAAAPCKKLDADSLRALALDCGADDCGLVPIDAPALDEDRPYIMAAFPATRTLLVLVARMNREPVRSPARSIANLEFHRVGDDVDETAHRIVRRLEDMGIRALNPAMAFPMEMDAFPNRAWVVSHKRAAVAAGLGHMGVHRSLIHPRFRSFVLLGTVLVDADFATYAEPLDTNPCLTCKLCVAACPVGALKPDGYFDFSACFNHNYQQFMGGFVNWIEDIADSRSAVDYRSKHSYAETVTRWQGLSYKPTYNAAYCIAACPAGSDVIGPYLESKGRFRDEVVRPLQKKVEPIYVARGSDAADYVAKRFPHETARVMRTSARATDIKTFLMGIRLGFQRGKEGDISLHLHRSRADRGHRGDPRPDSDSVRGTRGNPGFEGPRGFEKLDTLSQSGGLDRPPAGDANGPAEGTAPSAHRVR